MFKLLLFPIILACLPFVSVTVSVSDTVVGCGGFIRWKDNRTKQKLDFQKLKISLYSEVTNTLKDVTDILPNGAYSVPLYDEGLYRIKLSTPSGWYITPSSGHLLDLRGNSRVCANDFNFEVDGFTVTGQVTTSGMKSGPAGLFVHLSDQNGVVAVQNLTEPLGYFILAPVTPGQYLLTVSNEERYNKNHVRAKLSLTVTSDSVHLTEAIVLLGHFLRGHVVGFGKQSLPNTQIFIFLQTPEGNSTTTTANLLDGINAPVSVLNTVRQLDKSLKLIHVTESDKDGYFIFDRLPGGDYVLIPHFTGKSAIFKFESSHRRVKMEHTDINLGMNTFALKSFQLPSGHIQWSDGQPIASAKLTINPGAVVVITDNTGSYQFGDIVPGLYNIQIDAKGALFESTTVNITPYLDKLPDFRPFKVGVCGSFVTSHYLLTGNLKAMVIIRDEKTKQIVDHLEARIDENNHLAFCTHLPSGLYSFTPDAKIVNSNGHFEIVRFAPTVIQVKLTGSPVQHLLFTQFRAKLYGRLQCLDKCVSHNKFLFVELNSNDSGKSDLFSIILENPDSNVAYFTVTDVLPGDYLISIVYKSTSSNSDVLHPVSGWCWSTVVEQSQQHSLSSRSVDTISSVRSLHVGAQDLHYTTHRSLDFKQTGLLLHIEMHLPHYLQQTLPATVVRALAATTTAQQTNDTFSQRHTWSITDSHSNICLPSHNSNYQFNLFNPCAHFKMVDKISTSKHCGPLFTERAVLHISLAELPLIVHFKWNDNLLQMLRLVDNMTDLFQITNIPIKIKQAVIGDKAPASKTIFVNFDHKSVSGLNVNLWTKLDTRIQLQPQPSLEKKDSKLFNIFISPSEQEILLEYATSTTTSSSPDLFRSFDTNTITPMDDDPIDLKKLTESDTVSCTKLSSLQMLEFVVSITINLHGKIDPPVEHANIQLYRKSYPTKSPELSNDQIPVHTYFVPGVSDADLNSGDDTDPLILSTESNSLGLFSFNSMDLQQFTNISKLSDLAGQFDLNLTKPGYKFDVISSDNSPYHWLVKSSKLSLVEVMVVLDDEKVNRPLSGVLISIIGEGHRANQLTQTDGYAHFIGLAAGQYYVQPMMKEYSFIGTSQDLSSGQAFSIQVSEGKTATLKLLAHRIAFSASGIVTSLSGYPEANVLVEAKWLSNPQSDENVLQSDLIGNLTCQLKSYETSRVPMEESVTDSNGVFRIRGLLPGCAYSIKLQQDSKLLPKQQHTNHNRPSSSPSSNDVSVTKSRGVKRAIPESINLAMSNADVTGLKFYAYGELFVSVLTVTVDTTDEFLSTLKLVVFPADNPDLIVARHDFGQDSLLFTLSGEKLGALVGNDHIIRLTSDLKPNLYSNCGTQQIRFKPKLDQNEYHVFKFQPVMRTFVPD